MTFEELEKLVRPVGTGQTYKYGNVDSTIGGSINDHYLDINSAPLEIQYQAQKNMRGGLSPGGLITDYSGSNFTMGTGRIQHNYGDARIIEEQKAGREDEDVRSSYEIAAQLAALRRGSGGGGGNGRTAQEGKIELPASALTPDEELLALRNQGGNQLPKTIDEKKYELAITNRAIEEKKKKREAIADSYNKKKRDGEIQQNPDGSLSILTHEEVIDPVTQAVTVMKRFKPFSTSQNQEYTEGLNYGLIDKHPPMFRPPPPKPPEVPQSWWSKRTSDSVLSNDWDQAKIQMGNLWQDELVAPHRVGNAVSRGMGWLANTISGGAVPGAEMFPQTDIPAPYIPNAGRTYLSDEEIARRTHKINVGNIWTGGATNRSPF